MTRHEGEFVESHPNDKNKDVARMGHPVELWRIGHPTLLNDDLGGSCIIVVALVCAIHSERAAIGHV